MTTRALSALTITILGCAQSADLDTGQERSLTEPETRQDQNPDDVATLGLRLSRQNDDWRLIIELRNLGRDALRVDRKLVYLLDVEVVDSNGEYIADQIALPSLCQDTESQIEERLVELKPGERITRTLSLTKGFRSYGCSRATFADGSVRYHGEWVGAETCRAFDFEGLSPTDLEFKVTYGTHVGLGCPAYDTCVSEEQLGVFRGPLVADLCGDASITESDSH